MSGGHVAGIADPIAVCVRLVGIRRVLTVELASFGSNPDAHPHDLTLRRDDADEPEVNETRVNIGRTALGRSLGILA
jgi:hypothetical protein